MSDIIMTIFLVLIITLQSFLLFIMLKHKFRRKRLEKVDGIIYVNQDDPNDEFISLELKIPVGELVIRDNVTFVVIDKRL